MHGLMMEPKEFKTVRYDKGEARERKDPVPAESSVDIYLCGTRLVTLQATPDKLVELALGFLLSEGIFEDISEYESSSFDSGNTEVRVEAKDSSKVMARLLDRGEVIRTSGCGRGTTFGEYDKIDIVESDLQVSPRTITEMSGKMLETAELHKRSGGMHCSALIKGHAIVSLSEDIGRHNTIDKIVGDCALKGLGMSDSLLLTTGRASSEMVAKCARSAVPVIASLTSPTDLAIQIADKLGVTLVGYVRGSRLTVYTHRKRITK